MAKATVAVLDEKITNHETLCIEKYDNIRQRLIRIETMIIGSTISVMGLLLKLVLF
jgi:hypothetical protein